MMWYKASTMFMSTLDGINFTLYDNDSNVMAQTTIADLKNGPVSFYYNWILGGIRLYKNSKVNFALDYQTINGNLVLKSNGTTLGTYNPYNPLGTEINIPVPSNVSELENDSGFITLSAIPSNVSAFNNDVGYLTASSSALAEKRDYNDLTYPGTVYPSETHRIREFDLNIEGGYNPRRYTLNKFSTNVPNFGSMWANDEEYWNFAVATSNGEDFTFNKYGEGGEVATFTMSDVTAGVITFTMTDEQIEYTCHLRASMYETTLALKDYVDS